MDESILNLEQTADFLGISEKTLIKLLREENIPARKIGREWRFCRAALIEWISGGDSCNYINRSDLYRVSQDEDGKTSDLLASIGRKLELLQADSRLGQILPLVKEIGIPADTRLRVSYKQQRDVEKLEFKLYWPMRDESRCSGDMSAE